MDVTAPSDILLVTCVYEKTAKPAAAKDLYDSPYFARLRRYAERLAEPWFIVSAEHGLVHPDEWLAPYERYLPDTPTWYREVWGAWVVGRLKLLVGDLNELTAEILASPDYVVWIAPRLKESGAVARTPLADIPWQEHVAWYDEQERKSL